MKLIATLLVELFEADLKTFGAELLQGSLVHDCCDLSPLKQIRVNGDSGLHHLAFGLCYRVSVHVGRLCTTVLPVSSSTCYQEP